MKKFRIEIPEGCRAEVENGGIVCYPIEEPIFKVGDVVVFENKEKAYKRIDIIESLCTSAYTTSYECVNDRGVSFVRTPNNTTSVLDGVRHATDEEKKLLKLGALKAGMFWSDKSMKWIELKEGDVYYMSFDCVDCTIIFKEIYNGNICDHSYYNEKAACKLTINENSTGTIKDVINISEATEEQKQQLFDALAKEGKRWNAEKRCVEDVRWRPYIKETYWSYNNYFVVECKLNDGSIHDFRRFEIGNCFKSSEEAKKAAEYMKECWENYKPE